MWDQTRSKIDRLSAAAPTRAQADIFKHRDRTLARLRNEFPIAPGQSGAVFAVGGAICIDYLSRPDAFGLLYPKLLDGYLLDAVERLDAEPAAPESLGEMIKNLEAAPRSRRESVALGDDVRLNARGIVGSELELDDELIQLCAFSTDGDSSHVQTRITRPSRRR